MISFDAVPGIGTKVFLGEQEYELTEVEPYIRKDGAASHVLTWHTACPECGAGFDVRSGKKARELIRRCPVHRTIGAPVGKRGKRVVVRIVEKEARS